MTGKQHRVSVHCILGILLHPQRQPNIHNAITEGNMDAYFQDPNGWAGNKLRSRKTGKDIDYANVNQSPKELGLTAVWAFGIMSLFWRLFQVQVLEK